MKFISLITGGKGGNSARDESADPSSAEHSEAAVGVRLLTTSLVLYSQTSQSDIEFLRLAKATAIRILEYIGAQERLARSKAPYGTAPEDAKEKVTRERPQVSFASGRQLQFDLYCMRCSFQCWDCPKCTMYRCACYSCGCVLE